MQATLRALRPDSGQPMAPSISFLELQNIVGFPDYWQRETKYQVKD
jgi:hypothetical protein